jgi:Protein of unknown function (DUF4231)
LTALSYYDHPLEAVEMDPGPLKKRRPALIARFPRLVWRPPAADTWPVVSQQHLASYPELAVDLELWITQVEPRFRRLDQQAMMLQNQFWLQNVALIIGGLIATSIGAVQAAVGGGIEALAAVQAILTGLLAGLTVLIRSRRAQHGYLTARLKAERIKSEFFLFLGRVGNYAAGDPVVRL